MTVEAKVEKLEQKLYQIEVNNGKLEGEIKGKLDNIEKLLMTQQGYKDDVLTQREKHKVTENRLQKIENDYVGKEQFNKVEDRQMKMQESINGINLKIAMVSGAWTVVMLLISKL